MNLILMGAPGAGKGTQSEKISEKYHIPAIATGDILRAAIKAGTELGLTAKSYIDAGQLVPDSVVIGIIKEYLASDTCKNGFILDGFPRSIPQAEALDEMGVHIDVVLSIEVADEKIVERMSGRRVCPCGASYHIVYNPSKDGKSCDKCAEELSVRRDDAPEVVLSRLEVYHSTTEPLKDYYAKCGKLVLVDGVGTVDEISYRTVSALEA